MSRLAKHLKRRADEWAREQAERAEQAELAETVSGMDIWPLALGDVPSVEFEVKRVYAAIWEYNKDLGGTIRGLMADMFRIGQEYERKRDK